MHLLFVLFLFMNQMQTFLVYPENLSPGCGVMRPNFMFHVYPVYITGYFVLEIHANETLCQWIPDDLLCHLYGLAFVAILSASPILTAGIKNQAVLSEITSSGFSLVKGWPSSLLGFRGCPLEQRSLLVTRLMCDSECAGTTEWKVCEWLEGWLFVSCPLTTRVRQHLTSSCCTSPFRKQYRVATKNPCVMQW